MAALSRTKIRFFLNELNSGPLISLSFSSTLTKKMTISSAELIPNLNYVSNNPSSNKMLIALTDFEEGGVRTA